MSVNRKIKRDYHQPFFSTRRRRRGIRIWLFLIGLLMGGLVVFLYTQMDQIGLMVLDQLGIAPTPTPFASERAQSGIDLAVQGEMQDALTEFEMAVRQQPDNVDYIYEYGKLLIELDQSETAVEQGERLIELNSEDPRGYSLKANALVWSDPSGAIPVAITGLEKDPTFAPLHAALAIAYTNVGRWQEGLARGQLALELDPMDASVHRSYSIPLIYTGRNREAIDQLEEAIRLNPNVDAPYFELAAQYRAIEDEEMAVGIYRRILEFDPDNAKAYLRLCETYSSRGLFQEAESYCYDALDIDANYGRAYRELGRMQYNRRNYEGAIESFETCVALGATDIECYYLRGLAHYWLGQCDEAWDVLQVASTQAQQASILDAISTGLYNVTQNCVGFSGQALPTAIPPSPIPPTPIGGL